MAWEDEIQKAGSMVGDVGKVIESGLGIFGKVRETLYPATTQIPAPPTPIPEPKSAEPEWSAAALAKAAGLGDKPIVIIAVLVIGYLMFASKGR